MLRLVRTCIPAFFVLKQRSVRWMTPCLAPSAQTHLQHTCPFSPPSFCSKPNPAEWPSFSSAWSPHCRHSSLNTFYFFAVIIQSTPHFPRGLCILRVETWFQREIQMHLDQNTRLLGGGEYKEWGSSLCLNGEQSPRYIKWTHMEYMCGSMMAALITRLPEREH